MQSYGVRTDFSQPQVNRQVRGDLVKLRATNPKHFEFQQAEAAPDQFMTEFGRALRSAFYRVNDLQRNSDQLTRALAVDPDSVDVHDVTIAAEKARMSLSLTKSITDRITQAYRELINLR
jgi:flagellar hook-basal body complex protein FliE